MPPRRFRRAVDEEQREIEWSMVRFIPKRQVCLIVGKEGEGKSTFAAWLTAALTTGEYPNPEGTMERHEPQNVFINAREDPKHEITLGRLRAAGVDMERVVVQENRWELPRDLGLLRERIAELVADEFPPGVVILDPMIGHFRNPYHGHQQNEQALDGLITIAKRYNLSFVLTHHFIKGVRSAGTVRAAIGGMGAIQYVPKAIYVFGPDSPGAKTTKALAPQKFNYGRFPASLAFQLESWEEEFDGRMYEMSRLEYLGPIDVKAADIFDAAKYDERGTKRTGIQDATAFVIDYIRVQGRPAIDNPNVRLVRASALEDAAQQAGVWFSKGTYARARDAAGVRPVLAGELERLLGNEEAMFVQDRRGWVQAIVQQEEPPTYPPENPAEP